MDQNQYVTDRTSNKSQKERLQNLLADSSPTLSGQHFSFLLVFQGWSLPHWEWEHCFKVFNLISVTVHKLGDFFSHSLKVSCMEMFEAWIKETEKVGCPTGTWCWSWISASYLYKSSITVSSQSYFPLTLSSGWSRDLGKYNSAAYGEQGAELVT